MPDSTALPEDPTVLLISPAPDTHDALQRIFQVHNWRLHRVTMCREAMKLTRHKHFAVVICEQRMQDGDWRCVLRHSETLPEPPNLIVISLTPDEALWAEVLNLGGYDVLAQPFDRDEVYRVVESARRHNLRRST